MRCEKAVYAKSSNNNNNSLARVFAKQAKQCALFICGSLLLFCFLSLFIVTRYASITIIDNSMHL